MQSSTISLAIEMKQVYKTFGTRAILKGMDLNVKKGETMVILGPSGTGKSVTLKHITGLLEPDKGECFIFGEKISHIAEKKKKKIRAKMGVLFQSGALINWLNIFDNVALPLREHKIVKEKEVKDIVEEKLHLVDMLHVKNNFPNEISGGMKKRAGLARAIVAGPDIVLYDEPTSGLDPVMSNVINELTIKMQKELGLSSVVVTHDMSSAYMIADRISFVYEGNVLLCGSVSQIQKSENPIIQQFIHGKTKGPMILKHA